MRRAASALGVIRATGEGMGGAGGDGSSYRRRTNTCLVWADRLPGVAETQPDLLGQLARLRVHLAGVLIAFLFPIGDHGW